MAKQKTESKEAAKPKAKKFPFTPKEVIDLIEPDAQKPETFSADYNQKVLKIRFSDKVANPVDTLNEYTDLLRDAFQKQGEPGWKAFFYANGTRYVSTL